MKHINDAELRNALNQDGNKCFGGMCEHGKNNGVVFAPTNSHLAQVTVNAHQPSIGRG